MFKWTLQLYYGQPSAHSIHFKRGKKTFKELSVV